MLVVIPRLSDCVARPTEKGQQPFKLIPHLETVAGETGDKSGTPEDKLAFLAGLSHDAAKAAADWQVYINDKTIKRGPPHAPLGAALFAFWAEALIPLWTTDEGQQELLHDIALDWVRVIFRHHGQLDDLDEVTPWTRMSCLESRRPVNLLRTCNRNDLDALVAKHFPEHHGDLSAFGNWVDDHDSMWHYRQQTIRSGELFPRWKGDHQIDVKGLRIVELASRLIYADRHHASNWEPDHFGCEKARAAIAKHAVHCESEAEKSRREGADENLIAARSQQQQLALKKYQSNSHQQIFTLLLPTGYGKTLTGLRVALEAVANGRCKRIIYVAPYISILGQAAKDIEQATGTKPFLHHHMSIMGLTEHPAEDAQAEDHQSFDLLDTWQAPIIATTFNQLFRTQFPVRAQHCVKIPALDEAFVFIDEPQIVDLGVWCAFLRSLAITSQTRRAQILLTTATLPPLEDGLGPNAATFPLVADAEPVLNRFCIRFADELWDRQRVASEAVAGLKKNKSLAVIQNTIRDAIDTYRDIDRSSQSKWYFLAGPMLPSHKQSRIQEIKTGLKESSNRVGVVCTQILEAGVNLSFRSILRAFAYFSSIGQAAGRSNRHGEGDLAEVTVFRFVRDDETESADYIYRDQILKNHTLRTLRQYPELDESRLGTALSEFYESGWAENPHMMSLQWFDEAAKGTWSALAGKEPFESYEKTEVFIPESESYIGDSSIWKAFDCFTADGLLDRHGDADYRKTLSPVKRKQLSAALRMFTVSVSRQIALRVAQPIADYEWLWRLEDPCDYSATTGLAHHFTDEEFG